MRCLLYLKRSLLRRPGVHLTLYIVLTCAFLLPLLISIYRDSVAYGQKEFLLSASKGRAFHVQNAEQRDVQYFCGVDGLTDPVYEDGTIYLNILSDAQWQDVEAVTTYGNLILKRADETGNDRLVIRAYSYENAHGISTDDGDVSGQRLLLALNVCIILISVWIVRSAYLGHLRRFAQDMGILSACGASRRQIRRIFLAEFLLLFPLAAGSAAAVSIGVAKLLFGGLLEIKNVPGLAWLIFHVDVRNTLLHLLLFFAAMLAVLLRALRQYGKESPRELLRAGGSGDVLRHYKKPMAIKTRPSRSLAGLWRQRTNRIPKSCVWITLPIMVLFLFLFHYLITNLSVISSPPAYAFTLTKSMLQGFTADEIELAASLEGVASVAEIRSVPPDRYHMGSVSEETGGGRIGIKHYAGDGELRRFEVAVSKSQGFSIGDGIELYTFLEESGLEVLAASLTVARLLDVDISPGETDLYFSDSLYDELMAEAVVGELRLTLTGPTDYEPVKAALNDRFSGAEYEITDHQAKAGFMKSASVGYFVMLLYLFCILMLFILVIVSVRLRDYVESRGEYIKTLSALGAPGKVLYSSYMRQAAANAALAALLPVLLYGPLLALALIPAGVGPVFNGTVAAVHIAAALAVSTAYLLPTHGALKSVLRRL